MFNIFSKHQIVLQALLSKPSEKKKKSLLLRHGEIEIGGVLMFNSINAFNTSLLLVVTKIPQESFLVLYGFWTSWCVTQRALGFFFHLCN